MDSKIIQIITSPEELQELINNAVKKALEDLNLLQQLKPDPPSEYIKGIAGLAEFIRCSIPTAQKIKNSKKFPHYQSGRTLFFKSDEVLKALKK